MPSAPFRQKLIIQNPATLASLNSPQTYGFGGSPKMNFTLQATFFSLVNGGGVATAPTSGDIFAYASLDGNNFDTTTKVIEFNTASGDANSQIKAVQNVGPWESLQINWAITWGSANSCVVILTGIAPGDAM